MEHSCLAVMDIDPLVDQANEGSKKPIMPDWFPLDPFYSVPVKIFLRTLKSLPKMVDYPGTILYLHINANEACICPFFQNFSKTGLFDSENRLIRQAIINRNTIFIWPSDYEY